MAEKTVAERSLELHEKFRGKIEIKSRVPVKTKEDLSLAESADLEKYKALYKEVLEEYGE